MPIETGNRYRLGSHLDFRAPGPQDERRDDHHEDVFLDGHPEEFDAGPCRQLVAADDGVNGVRSELLASSRSIRH